MVERPSVSIITPTYCRQHLLKIMHRVVLAQTDTDWEWLIWDDSPEPSPYVSALSNRRIHDRHDQVRRTIGAKRNILVDHARGAIIAHFDDDDLYAPNYLSTMLPALGQSADFVKLSGWYLYSCQYRAVGYWDLRTLEGPHCVWSPKPMARCVFTEAERAALSHNYLGYGFSYVYRKSFWHATPFPDRSFGEDQSFVNTALAAGGKVQHFADTVGLIVHILRIDNISRCFPQYQLPPFLLIGYFPLKPVN